MTDQDRIDTYLDELADTLRTSGAKARRILVEAEDHLRQAVQELRESGMGEDEAARVAIERFGTPQIVANRFAAESRPTLVAMGKELAVALGGIAAIGLIAIGISGVLSVLFGSIFGWTFVAGDRPGVTYTAARCADYLRINPNASDCTNAAVIDHYWEIVGLRLVAGVVGIVALFGYLIVRRYWKPRAGHLPRSFSATIGTAIFGLAALGFTGMGMNHLVGGPSGSGQFLSAGLVSLAVFAGYGVFLARDLLQPARS